MNRQLNRRRARFRFWRIAGGVSLVLSLLVLSGCALSTPAPTATPTKTKMPTFTPAPPSATPTEVPPTATETPVPTPEPPTATPEPPTATPEPPTATPGPPTATRPPATRAPVQPTAVPPPPAAPDPCANIGGDGCKWRVTGGPQFGPNGGLELKLQLLFIHGGRNEPQGSYFVWLEKDGVKLPVSDSVRSIALSSNQGPLGSYNYEYAMGVDKLPGNTVAGHYRMWVLDGNGERDSRDVEFDVPADQGQIWIRFDQS